MSTTISFADYRQLPAINWSTLKHMPKSPLHYRYAADHPSEDTVGRLKGRGTHTAVLEPDRFLIDYALFKGKIRRGKEWEAFKALHAEENILKIDEYQHCLTVRDAIRNDAVAAEYLRKGKAEQSIEWTDEKTGLRCKARIDWICDAGVFDLKGVQSVEMGALSREVAKMQYHCQAAMYVEGVKRALGRTCSAHIIAAEHKAPHAVGVMEIDEDSLYAGWETVRDLLDTVAACIAADHWPGPHTEKKILRLPAWIWDEESDTDIGDEISFGAQSDMDTAQEE